MFGGATLAQDRDAASNDEGYVSFYFSCFCSFFVYSILFHSFWVVPDCLISSVTSLVLPALLSHASFARQLHVLQFIKFHCNCKWHVVTEMTTKFLASIPISNTLMIPLVHFFQYPLIVPLPNHNSTTPSPFLYHSSTTSTPNPQFSYTVDNFVDLPSTSSLSRQKRQKSSQ